MLHLITVKNYPFKQLQKNVQVPKIVAYIYCMNSAKHAWMQSLIIDPLRKSRPGKKMGKMYVCALHCTLDHNAFYTLADFRKR
jgi:hypothetical protein